jgi:tripartite-type tricarboxylate transporter receptor subunit TctC
MGPANMPAKVVDILNKAVNDTLAEPDTRTRLEQIGYSVAGGSAESFKETVRKNIETIRALNMQLD